MRALTTIRAWSSRLFAAWANIQSTEERRFQESMGVAPEDDVTEDEVKTAPCGEQEAAPNLTEIVRKRQEGQQRDSMYESDEAAREED